MSSEMVSDKIILVGDPDRVAMIAKFFDSIEHSTDHREFTSRTGRYKGKRITALSTGIGVGNIDIVVNELDSLVNVDLVNRRHKETIRTLQIVRIGTCGILQTDVPVHSFILSQFAFGIDNIAGFYDIHSTPEEVALNSAINSHITLPPSISTYTARASPELVTKLESERTVKGVTVTSPGFYGPHGRQLRLSTKTRELNDELSSFRFQEKQVLPTTTTTADLDTPTDALRVLNFEMESSALFALGGALGHHCATICLGIANRPNKQFSKDFTPFMINLIEYVLDRI